MKNSVFLLFVLAACLFAGCETTPKNTLHVFIWSDYLKPEIIERFKSECDCDVVIDTFDSNESMYAKLKLGGGGYDVIFPSAYFLEIMQPQGMVKTIDKSKIANLKNLDKKYIKKIDPALLDFGVPYMISSTGLIYRKDKVVQFEPSWSIFGNDDYKGRMTMLNDIREVFAAALSTLGYNINTTNEDEVKEAANQIIGWKKNLAKFESEQYKNGVASAEYLIAQGYNGDSLQVIQENDNVAFAYPKEGISMSMDFAVIPADAHNTELAYAFIDYLLRPEIAAENMAYTYFLSPNVPAYDLLPPDLASNPILFPPQEVLEKAEFIRDLGADSVLYTKAWDKIKAE